MQVSVPMMISYRIARVGLETERLNGREVYTIVATLDTYQKPRLPLVQTAQAFGYAGLQLNIVRLNNATVWKSQLRLDHEVTSASRVGRILIVD